MADLEDSLGRQFQSILEDLKKTMEDAAQNIVDFPKEAQQESNQSIDELKKTIQEFEKAIEGKLFENLEESTQQVVEDFESLRKEAENLKSEQKKGKKNFVEFNKLLKSVSKKLPSILQKTVETKIKPTSAGIPGSRPPNNVEAMLKDVDIIVENGEVKIGSATISGAAAGGGRGGDGGGEPPSVDFGKGEPEDYAKNIATYSKNLSNQINGIMSGFLGGASLTQVLFKGSVKDVTHFRKEMRKLAYEVDGIGASTRGLQADFADLGKVVAQTGAPIEATQEAYMKNLRKGFVSQEKGVKSQKEGLKIIKSGIHLSTMIGSDAASTADLFGEWNRSLGLSSNQMSQLARDSRDIAKSTGVTGDELLEAMKSSENLIKNMRNQGNLTNEAMANIIKGSAEAKKLGVGDQFNKIADALTSTNKFFFEADDKTKSFLYSMGARLGKFDDMASGEFMKSRQNMGLMANDMEKTIVNLGKSIGADITSFEDLGKLTPDQRKKLSIVLKSMTGMEITEFERVAKVAKKQSEGLGGVLSDLDKTMKSATATTEEKKLAEQEYSKAIQSSGMSMLSSVSEHLKDGGDLSTALDEMFKTGKLSKESFEADVGAIAKSMGKSAEGLSQTEKLQLAGVAAAEKLQAAAKERGIEVEDFSSKLKQAIASGDEKGYRELIEKMGEAEAQVAVKEKKGADPITDLAQTLEETNEYLRKMTSSLVGGLIDAIGSTGLLLIGLGATFASLALAFPSFLMGFKNILGIFGEGVGSSIGSLGGFIRGLGPIVGKAMGPLMLAMGGLKGAMEAKEAGRTTLEGGILGALTGGAKTGSFLSPMLGIKKGSAADKALGVAGATAWGAAAGASIGSIIPGVGTAIGAGIGAAIGGGTEILKIFTEGTDILADIFGPLQVVFDIISGTFSDLWKILSGIVTLNLGKVMDGVFSLIVSRIVAIPTIIFAMIRSIFVGIPKLIIKAIQWVFLGIPKMMMDAVKGAFDSLAASEWLGPIFKPISEAFGFIYDGFMAIWSPINDALTGLYNVFASITSAIFGSSKEGSTFTHVMSWVKFAFQAVGQAIGIILTPLKWLAQVIGWVAKLVGKLIEGIIYPFKYLYNVLVGNSIVPDLVTGIISWFAQLPGKIFNFLGSIVAAIPSMVAKAFSNLGNFLYRTLKKLPALFLKTMKSALIDFPKWLMNKLLDVMYSFGAFLSSLPSLIYNSFKKALGSIGKFIWDTISWPFRKIYDGIMWIASKLQEIWNSFVSGIASFFDLGAWGGFFSNIGSMIINGLTSIFVDLPVWLGTTIYNGFASIVSGIPSAIYKALYSAASAVGAGWLVKKLFGGGGGGTEKATGAQAGVTGGVTGAVVAGAGVAFVPKALEYVKSSFEPIASLGPKISGYAFSAFDSVKSLGSKFLGLFKNITPSGIKNIALGAFTRVKDFFGPMTTGFARSMKAGDGFFKAAAKGLRRQFIGMTGTTPQKLFGKLNGYAAKAFDYIKGKMPASVTKYASSAFDKVKNLFAPMAKGFSRSIKAGDGFFKAAAKGLRRQFIGMTGTTPQKLFGKLIPNNIKNLASSAFGKVKNFFGPLTTGFARSMKAGDGFFKAAAKGLRRQFIGMTGTTPQKLFGKVFSPLSKGFTSFFSPLTKGFGRSIKAGDGFFKAAIRGVKGQIASMSRNKGIIGKITNIAIKDMGRIKNIFSPVTKRLSSFFGPMTTGFARSMKAGDGFFKAAAKGLRRQFIGMTGTTPQKLFGKAASYVKSFMPKSGGGAIGSLKTLGTKGLSYAKSFLPKSGGGGLIGSLFGKAGWVATKVGKAFSSAGGVMGGLFGKSGVGMVAKLGGKTLLKSLPFVGAVAGAGFALHSLIKGDVMGAFTNLASGLASLIPGIGPVLSIGIDLFGKTITKGAVWLGKTAWGGIKKLGSTLWSGAKMAWGGVKKLGSAVWEGAKWYGKTWMKGASLAWGGVKKLGSAVWEGAKWYGKTWMKGAKFVGSTLWKGASNIGKGISWIATNAWEGAKNIGSSLLNGAINLGTKMWNGTTSVGSAISGFVSSIWDGAKNFGSAVGTFVSNTWQGAKDLGSKTWEGAKDLGSKAWQGAKDLGAKAWGGVKSLFGFGDVPQPPQETMEKINSLNSSIGERLENGAVHSIPFVRPAESENANAGAPNVQPVHLRDISQTILREKVGASSGNGKLQSDELSRIDEASSKQVEELEMIRESIQELVGIMKPRGGGASISAESNQVAGSTRDPRRPSHSAIYGRMKSGNLASNANKQVDILDNN